MSAELDRSLQLARDAKAKALEVFTEIAGSAAVGITRIGDRYGLKVNLVEPLPQNVTLPESVDGVPVRVEVTGRIVKRPLPAATERRGDSPR